MLSTNIFRYFDEPDFTTIPSLYWPNHFHNVVNRRNNNNKDNFWSTSIPIVGRYDPDEVAIKQEKDDKSGEVKIVIHAKHEVDDEFSEFRKRVKIPENVDHENLRTILSKEGVLILKAPYKKIMEPYMKRVKLNREDTWNGIWSELGRLTDHMNELVDVQGSTTTFQRPRTEFIGDESGESGVWRLKVNIGKDFQNPDQIKLHNHNNQIHLKAKSQLKDNNNCTSSRYIEEVISIPDGVEVDELRSKLMDDGELVIEAPCKRIPNLQNTNTNNSQTGKAIPIEMGKSSQNVENETMSVDNN